MLLPSDVPVMTLPNATLFPQVMLPLFIFEPRYRAMLADVLATERVFAIAMRQTRRRRETPQVAGLGMIRAAVTHPNGTSHLVLQGLGRVELGETVQERPYRRQQFRMLETVPTDKARTEGLTERVLALVAERFQNGFPSPIIDGLLKLTGKEEETVDQPPSAAAVQSIVDYLSKLDNPEQLADLVSCTLLTTPSQRQKILETLDLEERLKRLIRFLAMPAKK